MKLSEAIRLGSMMKPQSFNGYQGDASCALAAASEATGIPYRTHHLMKHPFVDYESLRERFPILNLPMQCSCGNQIGTEDLAGFIWHTNDLHYRTREFIADWVEQIENQTSETSREREEAELKR